MLTVYGVKRCIYMRLVSNIGIHSRLIQEVEVSIVRTTIRGMAVSCYNDVVLALLTQHTSIGSNSSTTTGAALGAVSRNSSLKERST